VNLLLSAETEPREEIEIGWVRVVRIQPSNQFSDVRLLDLLKGQQIAF
jgi:hypothetical protein